MSERLIAARGRTYRVIRDGQSAHLEVFHPSAGWTAVSGHEAVGILAEHLDAIEDAALDLAEAAVEGYLQGRLS